MSKVYSFRLDEKNPREAQAREAIDAWTSKGYSLRHILSEALIQYNKKDKSTSEADNLVGQLRELLKQSPSGQIKDNREKSTLPRPFTEAVSQSVKPGIRVNENL